MDDYPFVRPIVYTPAMDSWFLYLLECKNRYLYTGISTDVGRRFLQHQSGKGARFTRINPPIRIMGQKRYPDRSEASVAEVELKGFSRKKKLDWAEANPSSELPN